MFLSAGLLFLVELIVSKMTLPLLGGTPAVWNTCLVFFQTVLLAAYLYVYASTRWLGRRAQIALHIVLVLIPIAALPLHIPQTWEPPSQSNPIPWIIAMLSLVVGLSFFALAATAPMLQRWFSQSRHRSAGDPYFLYAASNTGSLLGLLGYPLLIEPALHLSTQARLWSGSYIVFTALIVTCGAVTWRTRTGPAAIETSSAGASAAAIPETEVTWRERLRWIALAFVPSSLMIGATTALTSDVPPIPLFWVLPLALYLVSFVLVFAKRPLISHRWMIERMPLAILGALIPAVSKTRLPLFVEIPLYLFALFAIAMVCHGELARRRPGVGHLTEYYLWISAGGALGGVFNSLLAPVIFPTVIEFPLVLVFAALLRPRPDAAPPPPEKAAKLRRNDWLLPAALGLCMVIVIVALRWLGLQPGKPVVILIFGYSMVWCMSFGKRPLRFALGVVAMLLASSLYTGPYGRILHTERSFFGVSRVTDDLSGRFRYLFHGGTIHGLESRDPARSRELFGYYTAQGPAGSIFQAMQSKVAVAHAAVDPPSRWAFVGLGTGAMACFLPSGSSLTYYEIDPAVKRIATDSQFFSYLGQCAPDARIVLGDARISLRDAPDGAYDLIAIDAFSGDMIPMHLMTREALALYLRKLAPGGVLVFHISNLYLDLAPSLGGLASDAGLTCLLGDDDSATQAQIENGKFPSRWIVMARKPADLGSLTADSRWIPPPHISAGARIWTDDYSNLLSVIRWK